MNVLITGSSGLIGTALVQYLSNSGHAVRRLTRGQADAGHPTWDIQRGYIDSSAFDDIDAVIHLAGARIIRRWTHAHMERIRRSRVEGTRLISTAIAGRAQRPRVLLSASAIGFYGHRADEPLDETCPAGSGFLPEVCSQWEAATRPAAESGVRVAHLRFGVVLSVTGGALASMLPVFRAGLGGPLGSGRQFMSWIAIDDVVSSIEHLLAQPALTGPVNIVSPNPLTNRAFTRALAAALHRPAVLPVPRAALWLALGKLADEALLASARVHPRRLEESGFRFQYPSIESALAHELAAGTT